MFFYAPVYLKYKGSGKYRTFLGGVLSLLLVLLLILYIPGKMLQLVGKEAPFVSSHSVYHNLEDSFGRIAARDLRFDFAITA